MTSVVVEQEAQDHIFEIGMWWWTHRTAARTLFADELDAAWELLAVAPRAGSIFRRARRPGVRRLLLPRTAHWVYYVHDPRRDVVHVFAVWGAPRGDHPQVPMRLRPID